MDDGYTNILSIADLKAKLSLEAKIRNLPQMYKLSCLRNYAYARCKKCPAHIRYRRIENDCYQLIKFQTNHRHQKVNLNTHVLNFIKDLPSMPTNSKMKITTKTFNISKSKFYYLNKKIWQVDQSWAQIIQQFDDLFYQTRYQPYPLVMNSNPDVIITSTPSMRRNFQQYGQFTSIDVTYNVVKDTNHSPLEGHKPTWGLALFMGKNNRNKIIPFAIALMNSETTQTMENVFRSFIDIMGKEPSVFLSDQQKSIIGSIKNLQSSREYSGYHLFDVYHVLKNFKKKVQNQKIVSLINTAMMTHNYSQYIACIEKASEEADNSTQMEAVENFIQNSSKYCFANAPVCFHGLSLTTSFAQKANDLIKQQLEYAMPMKAVLKKVLSIMEKLEAKSKIISKSNVDASMFLDWKQLKVVKEMVCSKVYVQIVKNYIGSLTLRVENITPRKYQVEDEEVSIDQRKVTCSCKYFEKCGLPCIHTMRILPFKQKFVSLFNQVAPRWIIQPEEINIMKGRPRLSRRN